MAKSTCSAFSYAEFRSCHPCKKLGVAVHARGHSPWGDGLLAASKGKVVIKLRENEAERDTGAWHCHVGSHRQQTTLVASAVSATKGGCFHLEKELKIHRIKTLRTYDNASSRQMEVIR